MLYADWFFIEGEKVCQLKANCRFIYVPRRRTYFSKILQSKGCYFERGTSFARNKLLHDTGAFGRESEVVCCLSKVHDVFPYPVPNPSACPKIEFFWIMFVPRLLCYSGVKFRLRSPDVKRKTLYQGMIITLRNGYINATVFTVL